MTTTTVRAHELRPGDVLAPVGLTVQRVTVDAPGQDGRLVHIAHDLGVCDVPLNGLIEVRRSGGGVR